MQFIHWKVDPGREVTTAAMLADDPDKYGGLGMHMAACIAQGVVSVPLTDGVFSVSINVTARAAERILADGGIRIEKKHWVNVNSPNLARRFLTTDEEVPIISTFFSGR
jgi:hypothetical protein